MNIVGEEKSWLEWLVFALSSTLLVALVGYLLRDMAQDNGTPPDLRIELGEPTRSAHGFVVPVEVLNQGDQTAMEIKIEVAHEGNRVESSTLEFDFLSSQEKMSGWVGFSGAPTGKFTPRVVGYRVQ